MGTCEGDPGLTQGLTVAGGWLVLTCHVAQARSLFLFSYFGIAWGFGEQRLHENQEIFNLAAWPVQGPCQQGGLCHGRGQICPLDSARASIQ